MHIFALIDWRIRLMQEVLGALKSCPAWPADVSFRMEGPKAGIRRWPQVRRWRVDGAICVLQDKVSLRSLKRAVPCLVNLEWTQGDRIPPDVGLDLDATSRLAIDHALEMGFTSLAYYGWGRWVPELRIRCAAERVSLPVNVFHMDLGRRAPRGMRVWDTQAEQISEWLASLPEGTCVICGTDYDGLTIMDLCQDIGRHVPDEIGVLGIGDDPSCHELSRPHLSSIRLPGRSLGLAAAQRLVEKITTPGLSQEPILLPPAGVAQRGSTGRVLCDDPTVRQALRFIHDRATLGIRAEDVVEYAGISRTGLEQKVRKAIGRTPAQEIERLRMAAAERMLIETDLPIGQIAVRCGFSRLEHFTRAFSRVHGMPPTQFRTR